MKVCFDQFMNFESFSGEFYLQSLQTSEIGKSLFRKLRYLIGTQRPRNEKTLIKEQISINNYNMTNN